LGCLGLGLSVALSLFKTGFGSERAAEGAQASEEEDERQARGASAGGGVVTLPVLRLPVPQFRRSVSFVRFFASMKSPAHFLSLSTFLLFLAGITCNP
jgi:hypothetical protein